MPLPSLAALSANTNDAVSGSDNPVVAAPDVDAMKRGPEDPYKRTEQSDICDAFGKVSGSEILSYNAFIKIGKQGMFAATPRALKTSVDALADEIIDEVPTCAGKAKSDTSDLDDTLEKALNAYA
ncbi:hypothetical protein PFICI_05982 [Pestalotiopsis fici W106-1]|uniref:Uncharacterized protein n=1 Tax=Pestalotiopsis fici (strain W106-1 / CGMCC3.15140) TaxID=1229662 RepID=W3X4J0_PESFW|nr:uncharacterized protein PFICI_05982 [Pestalotiopsis fici W106-1]ETS80980.1 hypothetical protein PFICI_05982 [Pestalotiopsis fici W106-1]